MRMFPYINPERRFLSELFPHPFIFKIYIFEGLKCIGSLFIVVNQINNSEASFSKHIKDLILLADEIAFFEGAFRGGTEGLFCDACDPELSNIAIYIVTKTKEILSLPPMIGVKSISILILYKKY